MESILTNIISSLISGLIGAIAGAWLAFRYQRKAEENHELKEYRFRLLHIRSELEAYEYILKGLSEDYQRIAYRYAFKFTKYRLTGIDSDLKQQELADRLEKTRTDFEMNMFSFRKLISELKGITNEHEQINEIVTPIIKENFNKWNFLFNKMQKESEFTAWEKSNKDDDFGQGGKSIQPGLVVEEMKIRQRENFKYLYQFVDNRIQNLQPKNLLSKLNNQQ